MDSWRDGVDSWRDGVDSWRDGVDSLKDGWRSGLAFPSVKSIVHMHVEIYSSPNIVTRH